MPSRQHLWTARAVACLLCTLTLFGCEQPKWDDPAYVSAQLNDEDPNRRKAALERIKELPLAERQAMVKATVPALTNLYKRKDSNQRDVLDMLLPLRDAAAVEVYVDELKNNSFKQAGNAAELLGELKHQAALPDMLKLLESSDDPDVKQGILRGFKHMPDASLVAPLTTVLKLDADDHPIALHAYSCEVLGEVALIAPEAFDADAKKTLVRSVFLANNLRQDVSRQCGLAVQKLGDPVIPELIALFKGENEGVQRLMMAYKFPPNRSRGVATNRLTSLRAKEAGPLFIEALNVKVAVPDDIARDQRLPWVQIEAQVFGEMILGLGDLRATEARPLLESVLQGQKNADWEPIRDYAVEAQLRQDAARALNLIGDRAAAPTLLAVAKTGKIEDLEKLAEATAKQGQPMADLERYTLNYTVAQAYVNLAGADAEAGLNEIIAASKGEGLKAALEKLRPAAKLHASCTARGDQAAQATCYGEQLKDAEPATRTKAVHELSRLAAAISSPVLAANIATDSLDTRELIGSALYHAPSPEALKQVEATLTKSESSRGDAARLDRNRLELLRAFLKNKVKG